MAILVDIIQSETPEIRNQSLDLICSGKSVEELLNECDELEIERRDRAVPPGGRL